MISSKLECRSYSRQKLFRFPSSSHGFQSLNSQYLHWSPLHLLSHFSHPSIVILRDRTMSTKTRSRSTVRQRSLERSGKFTKSSSASRNASPSTPSRRIAKLNLYLSKAASKSSDQLKTASEPLPDSPRVSSIRRWDGNQRTTVQWDSVRRVCSWNLVWYIDMRQEP